MEESSCSWVQMNVMVVIYPYFLFFSSSAGPFICMHMEVIRYCYNRVPIYVNYANVSRHVYESGHPRPLAKGGRHPQIARPNLTWERESFQLD